MYYITVRQSPMYRQITLEELFGFTEITQPAIINQNTSNTKTYETEKISEHFLATVDVPTLIRKLAGFNNHYESLRNKPREELYETFHIPKKSGGLRRIDAPCDELMKALRELKGIFEEDFHALYHTAAFAYAKKRSTVMAVERHQKNESRWFGKYDLSNFFGSSTPDFVIRMLEMIFPFSEVLKNEYGRRELIKALELGFLNGGLPQGTPLSPMLTNIIMIPVDYTLSKELRNHNKQSFVYTRYADDFLVSSKYSFSFREIEKLIVDTLKSFGAPFTINSKKTRYGSSAGSNWNLGIMLGKENKLTVGHKKKRQFCAMLTNYVLDRKNGVQWDKHDVQIMDGYRNYYIMVEGRESIDGIVNHIGEKYNVDIIRMIKEDLRRV